MMTENNTLKIPAKKGADSKKPISAHLGGSEHDPFNMALVHDVLRTFWKPEKESPHRKDWDQRAQTEAVFALYGIAPENEVEGMYAAQMVAAHAATMECYRRAAITDQHFETSEQNLKLATKASRTFVHLTESLQKLRGKTGQQSVHVHHHHHQQDNRTQVAAENAVVNISQPHGEGENKNAGQPHEPGLTHQPGLQVEPSPAMRCKEPAGAAVPSASDERQEKMPPARRKKPRRTQR